jgi:hypothetical protein
MCIAKKPFIFPLGSEYSTVHFHPQDDPRKKVSIFPFKVTLATVVTLRDVRKKGSKRRKNGS